MTDGAVPTGPGATSDLLAGTQWRIASIAGTAALAAEDLVVEFGHDGRASGSTGVNQFTTSYSVTAEYLTFGPLATTRRTGPPKLVEQESRVIASLAGMCPYVLERSSLVFEGPLGRVELATTAAPPPEPVYAELPPEDADEPS